MRQMHRQSGTDNTWCAPVRRTSPNQAKYSANSLPVEHLPRSATAEPRCNVGSASSLHVMPWKEALTIKYAVYSQDSHGERVLRACDLPSEQAAMDWIGRLLAGVYPKPDKMGMTDRSRSS
jgi:hypothetical protein